MIDSEQKRLLADILPRYAPFESGAAFDGEMLLSRFDSMVTKRFCLFSIGENFDFDRLEANLDLMAECMPALLRIFEKPLIHLRETEEMVPVEVAVKTGAETMKHAALHSEIWDGEAADRLHPFKLLTTKSEDDYTIYENRVFAHVVDILLGYCDYSRHRLSGRIFNSMQLNINLLDRSNHKNYFLALASLHSAYDNSTDTSFERAEADYRRIQKLEAALKARTRSRVYRLNRGLFTGGEIKSTNILTMHRDYRVLGYLLSRFNSGVHRITLPTDREISTFFKLYGKFCAVLLLFAVRNFGFEAADDLSVRVFLPSVTLTNGECQLKITTKEAGSSEYFVLHFHNHTDYRIVLLPFGADTPSVLARLPKHNEIVRMRPYFDEENPGIAVAIDDVDSFRRLDRIFLRGMIYADGIFGVCPFCGSNMDAIDPDTGAHFCSVCRTSVMERLCPETMKNYYTTAIPGFRPSESDLEFAHDTSALLRYRNITDITRNGDSICPHCGKIHG